MREESGGEDVSLQGSLTPLKVTGATRQNTMVEVRKGENNEE
jgi:hypothetical protein